MRVPLYLKLKTFLAGHLPAMINPEGHLPPVLKKIALFLAYTIYPKTFDNLTVIKILKGPLRGTKMIVNLIPKNGATDTEYFAGYRQERNEIELLKKMVTTGQTIWDIGIYRGFYSILLSKLIGPKGKVIAFDIEKKNCRVINEVLRINKISNVTVHNYGLSNQDIEADFISSPSSNSRLITTFRGYYTKSPVLTQGEFIDKVQLRTLNSLVDEMGTPDFIKIDIDGAELFALDQADKLFINPDIIITIESHNPDTDKKITQYFNRNNCFVYSINEKRMFTRDEIYWGTVIGCRNYNKLLVLL